MQLLQKLPNKLNGLHYAREYIYSSRVLELNEICSAKEANDSPDLSLIESQTGALAHIYETMVLCTIKMGLRATF
jgi:hypothetical protein